MNQKAVTPIKSMLRLPTCRQVAHLYALKIIELFQSE